MQPSPVAAVAGDGPRAGVHDPGVDATVQVHGLVRAEADALPSEGLA